MTVRKKKGPCLIIAEAGVNHNGSLARALRLVDAAAAAGADAVKFQTFRADALVTAQAPKAAYQRARTGEGTQREMLRALELTERDHRALIRRCRQKSIEFLSTPFDEGSARMLLRLGVKKFKIASGELTNRPFLELLARWGRPLILSTGMATLTEVKEAVAWVRRASARTVLTLLHCVSAYPVDDDDANVSAMLALRKIFQTPVGYSDHTRGIWAAVAAAALGADVIEKHLTLDRGLPGPDHQASLEPAEFKKMVEGIRSVERLLGDGRKRPRSAELPLAKIARRSLFAARDCPRGHTLRRSDLAIQRPVVGLLPKHFGRVLGRRLRQPVRAGDPIFQRHLAP